MFKALAEKQTGHKIKIIRTDNGTEFCNNNFIRLCENDGIHHQTSAVYSPQQNCRTIMKKVRCMIIDAGVSKSFWAEAVLTAVYLINRIPSKGSGAKSPEEIWSGKQPNLSFIKVFGCRAFAQVPAVKRKKLDEKSIECV